MSPNLGPAGLRGARFQAVFAGSRSAGIGWNLWGSLSHFLPQHTSPDLGFGGRATSKENLRSGAAEPETRLSSATRDRDRLDGVPGNLLGAVDGSSSTSEVGDCSVQALEVEAVGFDDAIPLAVHAIDYLLDP